MGKREIYKKEDFGLFSNKVKCECGRDASLEYDGRWKLFAYFCKHCKKASWATVKRK